jgi:hypothetical protein
MNRFAIFSTLLNMDPVLHNVEFEALLVTCFHAGFLLDLFFDPEDGGEMFLRNVG